MFFQLWLKGTIRIQPVMTKEYKIELSILKRQHELLQHKE